MFVVFPAHAGMIPDNYGLNLYGDSVPRTRGDDPGTNITATVPNSCSPHTRG